LEHSRIYHFLNSGNEEFYIGSADWMNRNLDYRVEAITPIEDPLLRERLREILDIMHCDRGHAWELQLDGVWKRLTPAEGGTSGGTHLTLMSRTMRQAKRAKPGR
jgi:polyphosphate kinase